MNRKQVSEWLFIGLIFMLGWHVGHIMSPYYSAQPVIFNDNGGEGIEKLQALAASKPEVAGATSENNSSALMGEYVASVNSELYHHISCASSKRIKEENRVYFLSGEEAQQAGYSPSSCIKDLSGE